MAVTVEYGKCEKCGDNNVKTAELCRKCQEPLPWSKGAKAQAKAMTTHGSPLNAPIKIEHNIATGFYVQILGGIIFVGGVFLYLGNRLGFFPTFPGAGWITLIIGGVIWRVGASMD